jgi:hypothetical protein
VSDRQEPEIFIVVWNGVLMEGEWYDAIAFSRPDAQAIIDASPGRKESYCIETSTLSLLSQVYVYGDAVARLRERLARGDRTPLMLKPESERAKRGH